MIKFVVSLPKITIDTEKALRAATFALWATMRQRIFFEGLKANGSGIGVYTPKYLAFRQKYYNRTSDPKKILVLTDSLRLNFIFEALNKNTYGIGINGQDNIDKAEWNDPNNEIFTPSENEIKITNQVFQNNL